MSNLSLSLSLSEQSPCSISSLVDLALFSDDSRKATQAASKALDLATRGAFNNAAASILSHMGQAASSDDAVAIVQAAISREAFDAVMLHSANIADLGLYVRKAQKLASRVMACAVAVVAGACPSLRINRLEGIAAHIRKGFPLSSLPLSLSGADEGRLAAVVVAGDANDEGYALSLALAKIAELEATVAAYRASFDAVMHGRSSVVMHNTAQRKGKGKTTLVAA